MFIITKNRYLDSFLKLLLVSAIIHFTLLVGYSIIHLELTPLNYFHILAIDLFFPSIMSVKYINYISAIPVIIIYVLAYIYFTGNNRK